MTATPISARVLLLILLALLSASPVSGASRIDAKQWRRVKTYEMAALQKMEPLPMRMIVGVRFNYRYATIRHLKPNWFQGSIWHHRQTGNREDLDHIPVMVAKADVSAFERMPTQLQVGRSFTVYGQILKDQDANYIFLRLLGTKVKRNGRGNATVNW